MAPPKIRRSRDELRALVLEAGREVLLQIEPTLGFAKLNYGAVFAHLQDTKGVRVTHASVHERIWPNQQSFQLDVLKAALEPVPVEAYETFADPLTAAIEQADLTTIEGRRAASRELVRVGQNENWDATMLRETSALRTYHMIRLSLAASDLAVGDLESDHPERSDLFSLMRDLRASAQNRYVTLMGAMCDLLGLRPLAALGPRQAAVATVARTANACAVGFMLDETVAPDAMLQLATGPDGSLQDWRPASLGVWSVLSGLFELADEGLEPQERSIVFF